MKTIVVCATIFCLELVSSYPYPEPLPGYYEAYEQVPQQMPIPNIARSPDLYHQQQLAYIQQQNDNIRRQNYENMLRNQNLNQRLLQRPSYNIQPVLTTVREPYVNSIPLQPLQQAHYEAPITQQYYQNVQSVHPIAQYQPVQSQQYEETRSEANAETGQTQQINNPYPQQQYPRYNAQNMRYNPRIQQVLASTPLKKRYLVLHPNGTIEHIDKIEHIVEQHPNYILYNAGGVTHKPNVPIVAPSVPATATAQANTHPVSPTSGPVAQVAPIAPVASSAPVVPIAAPASPVTPVPVAPLAPFVPATAAGQANAAPMSPTSAPVAQVAPIAPVASTAPVVPNAAPASPVTPAPVAQLAPVVPVNGAGQANPDPASAPHPVTSVVPDTAGAQSNPDLAQPTPAPVEPIAPMAPFVPAIAAGQANPDLASPTPVPATSVIQAAVPASPTPATDVPQPNVDPAASLTSGPKPVNGSPVAPFAPAVPPFPYAPVPAPTIQNVTVPGFKPTVPPPTGPTTARPPVSAPIAQPPVFLNGTVPAPTPTVPPTGPTTALPPVSAQTAQPPVILNGTGTVWVTATATAVYPPPTTPLPPTIPPPTVTPVTPVAPAVGPVTPVSTATPISPVTDIATPAPAVTASPVDSTEELDTPTTVAPYTKPRDLNTDLDVLHLNNGVEPVVWFRTKDLDFWNKLTNGKETYDVVYLFNIPREPRMTKEVKTTIHADGTVVEEITQTIIDDEDETPPRVIKTTKVTKPDGTQSTT